MKLERKQLKITIAVIVIVVKQLPNEGGEKIDKPKSKSTGVGKNKRSSNKKAGTFTNVVTTNTITSTAGNFEFVPPYQRIKWRRLAEANVQSLKNRGDIHGILSHLEDVTYGDVGDYVDAPPAMMKAFQLSQYAVQYLLHTQQVLREGANQVDIRKEKALKKLENVKARLKMQRDERRHLNSELKRTKRVIKSHKSVLGAVSPHLQDIDPSNLDEALRKGVEARKMNEEVQKAEQEARRLREEVEYQRREIDAQRKQWKSEMEREKERMEQELSRKAKDHAKKVMEQEQERLTKMKKQHDEEEKERQRKIKEEEQAKHLEREKQLFEAEQQRLLELKKEA